VGDALNHELEVCERRSLASHYTLTTASVFLQFLILTPKPKTHTTPVALWFVYRDEKWLAESWRADRVCTCWRWYSNWTPVNTVSAPVVFSDSHFCHPPLLMMSCRLNSVSTSLLYTRIIIVALKFDTKIVWKSTLPMIETLW